MFDQWDIRWKIDIFLYLLPVAYCLCHWSLGLWLKCSGFTSTNVPLFSAMTTCYSKVVTKLIVLKKDDHCWDQVIKIKLLNLIAAFSIMHSKENCLNDNFRFQFFSNHRRFFWLSILFSSAFLLYMSEMESVTDKLELYKL